MAQFTRWMVLLLCVMLVGCHKRSEPITEADANRVGMHMTQAEVELQLGGGEDITKSGPKNTNLSPWFWPPKSKADKIMQWGKDDRVLFVHFVNGRVTEVSTSDLKTPDHLRPTPEQKEAVAERESRMVQVGSLLHVLKGLDRQLPAGPESLKSVNNFVLDDVVRDIREGKIVIRWGRSYDDLLTAYEADVPKSGGWVISKGDPREVSASEFERLLSLSP